MQEEVPDKIPGGFIEFVSRSLSQFLTSILFGITESASEISPYATFQLGDGSNTLLHSIMYQDRELMEGAPTPETTVNILLHFTKIKN